MNFIILFFSLVAYPILKYKFDKKENDIYNGCDNRFPTSENSIDDGQIIISKLGKYFLYKNLLKTLENDKVSIQDKVKIIEDNNIPHLNKSNSKYATNLLAGGLVDDFNFEL